MRLRSRLRLAAWAGLCSAVLAHPGGYSWHGFSDGALLLFGAHPHGLSAAAGPHLYADYPQFQIRPISFLRARALAPFGIHVAEAIMLGVGAWGALELQRLALLATVSATGTGALARVAARRRVFLGQLLVPLWVELAVHFGHLAGLLPLGFAVAAVSAVARGSHAWTGPLLMAAIAANVALLLLAVTGRAGHLDGHLRPAGHDPLAEADLRGGERPVVAFTPEAEGERAA